MFLEYLKRLDNFKRPVTFTVSNSYTLNKDNKYTWGSYGSWPGFFLTITGVLSILIHCFIQVKDIGRGKFDTYNKLISTPKLDSDGNTKTYDMNDFNFLPSIEMSLLNLSPD